MGMSYSARAIVPATDKYIHFKNIYEMCKNANVEIPDEVDNFFEYGTPRKDGMEFHLHMSDMKNDDNDYSSYMRVDVADIPKDAKYIDFVLSI